MSPLSSGDLHAVHMLVRSLDRGDTLDQQRMDALREAWEPKISPSVKNRSEEFAVALPDGSVRDVAGPRWIFHLFGIRHRAAEVALRTRSDLIVLQRRSPTKDQWPNALDMAVSGHIPHTRDGTKLSYEQGAWKEIEEEIGLCETDRRIVFAEGKLVPVGGPYCCFEGDWRRNPPFFDAEVRQIFAGTLTGEGLARLQFNDNEVAGILLVTREMAWQILTDESIASGLRYSLPRYLDWLEQSGKRSGPAPHGSVGLPASPE